MTAHRNSRDRLANSGLDPRCKKRQESAARLASILPRIFAFAQQRGVPLASPPFTRYLEMGRGTTTIEAGFAVGTAATGDGDILAGELPGGDAAVAIHPGPYDRLGDTHAIVATWLDAQGLTAGAPWEVYVTDPGDKPDPADWRTEVIYPTR